MSLSSIVFGEVFSRLMKACQLGGPGRHKRQRERGSLPAGLLCFDGQLEFNLLLLWRSGE